MSVWAVEQQTRTGPNRKNVQWATGLGYRVITESGKTVKIKDKVFHSTGIIHPQTERMLSKVGSTSLNANVSSWTVKFLE